MAGWICIRNEFLLVRRGARGSAVMRTGRHLTFCVAGCGAVSIPHPSRITEREREIEIVKEKKLRHWKWVGEARKRTGWRDVGGGGGAEED